MIHVVTPDNRAEYARQIGEMHRQRWACFIEQKGWRALRASQEVEGYERDEFDDDRAVYLMALTPSGDVLGSMRLRPADDKSIVGDVCAGAIDPDVKSAFGPLDWEITRAMRAPGYEGPEGAIRLQLTTAACEFALEQGIRRYVCCVDTYMLPAMRALNREKHSVLGLPAPYGEGEMIAVELRPDQEWLDRVHLMTGSSAPMLHRVPSFAPKMAAAQ
jgi:acyl-homoserine lactone synthase